MTPKTASGSGQNSSFPASLVSLVVTAESH